MLPDNEIANYENFRDCVSELVISKLSRTAKTKKKRATKGRKNEIKPVVIAPSKEDTEDDAAELGDFIEYLALEMFTSLPPELRTLSYSVIQNDTSLAERYDTPLNTTVYDSLLAPLPPSVHDSLTTYHLLPESVDLARLLELVYTSYINLCVLPPPEHAPLTQRATECEICEREHLPLTYHHLIPRQMHVKAVKRGWAKEWELQKVAWLCRACHSFVHRVLSNEELAREFGSVELLMEREDVRSFAGWVGRVRWKAR